ncbi:MAG: DedA family protein [Alphaproteobacteria bacterium]|nr:MAG: DedA family protein [Alphaproteobacteria bacterium]
MLRSLYDRVMALAGHRHAIRVLAIVAFMESSVFPIPPDVMIVPMVLAARAQAWRIAAVATVASVLGGVLGYAIGAGLFETVGRPILELYGYTDRFAAFQETYREWGAWIVAGAGFTPFPYKVITIASGVAQLDLGVFLVASATSRGARFFLEVALLWWFGPPIRAFIERYLPALTWLFFILLFAGFVAIRYVF